MENNQIEQGRLEGEITRSFSRIFLKIGKYMITKRACELEKINEESQRYNELKTKYGSKAHLDLQMYDEIINFTSATVGLPKRIKWN